MALLGEFEAAVRAADPDREPDQFKLCGELFTVSDRDLTVPMGRFAQVARAGTNVGTMAALAAMMDLLESVVIEADRERLVTTAARGGVDEEVIFDVVKTVMAATTGRPTKRPSDSSGGPSTIGASSTGSPFGPAVSPIMQDPRVRELQSVGDAALSLVS